MLPTEALDNLDNIEIDGRPMMLREYVPQDRVGAIREVGMAGEGL